MKTILLCTLILGGSFSFANEACRVATVSDFLSEEQYLTGDEAMYCTNSIDLAYPYSSPNMAPGKLHPKPVFYVQVKRSNPNMGFDWNELIFTHSNNIPPEIIGRTSGIRTQDKWSDVQIGQLPVTSQVIGCYEFAYDKNGCINDSREPKTEFTFQKCGDRLIGTGRSYTLSLKDVDGYSQSSTQWVGGKPRQIECIRRKK